MTRRLGLIVRADFGGGLANQSYECWRHLEPDATLCVLMGHRGRGTREEPERYDGALTVDYGAPDTETMRAFLDRIDVLLSIETFYVPFLLIRGGELGIERVLYANPELLLTDDPAESADRYLFPAPFPHPFPAEGAVLPWPCSTDVTPREQIGWPPRFVHVGAPAMLDRNGTAVVEEAAGLIRSECELAIYGRPAPARQNGPAKITNPEPVADLWDLYRDADCLVLPRRYGCLSLPMLEAAALGVPTLTTDMLPQAEWFAPWAAWLIHPAGDPRMAPMKGGLVAVHQPRAEVVAAAIDRLAPRDDLLDSMREEVRAWAEGRSWEKLRPAWEAIIR